MARRSSEAVWTRGLLTKGNGICHGVAGNGYAFLSLRKADGADGRHLHRARSFAGVWCRACCCCCRLVAASVYLCCNVVRIYISINLARLVSVFSLLFSGLFWQAGDVTSPKQKEYRTLFLACLSPSSCKH